MSGQVKSGTYNSLGIQEGETATNIQENSRSFLPFTVHRRSRIVRRSNGRSLMKHINVGSLRFQMFGYLTDGFTTLINSPWWVIILFFCLLYLISWLLFAGVWTLVAYVDGHFNNTCLNNVHDFSSAFLFSVETEMTIGYGNKFIASDCGWGIFILILQCLVGLIIDSFILGLMFAKLTRPRNRRKTIIFSDEAVIYKKNGDSYLELRICDLRHSQIVECHVRLTLYWNKLINPGATKEEDRYEFQQCDLECGYDTGQDRILLLTPTLIHHKITPSSPLYGMAQTELNSQDLEILVNMEGIVESTGLTVQALWSYTSEEVVFDHRFLSMVKRREGKWEVDFARLNAMEPCQS